METMMTLLGLIKASEDRMALAVNEKLSPGNLAITREEMERLAERRAASLASLERVEFGTPAIVGMAEAMATSPYLEQEELAEVLAALQDAFYELRADLEVDVPDDEIFEAIRGCFDTFGGDAIEVASMPASEVMPFSKNYLQAIENNGTETHCVVDDDGREYSFDPAQWNYNEYSNGWNGERWSDDWED